MAVALAGLGDFAVALGLLCIAVLTFVALEILRRISGHVSLFGWHPLDIVVSWLEDAVNWEVKASEDVFKFGVSVLEWVFRQVMGFIGATLGVADRLAGGVEHIVNVALGDVERDAKIWTYDALRAVIAEYDGLLRGIESDIQDADDAIKYLASHLGLLTTADLYRILQFIENHFTVTVAAGAIDAVIGPIEREIVDELKRVLGDIDPLRGLAALSIPAAIGLVASLVQTLARTVEDCAVSKCGGPNDISNVLKSILGVVETGAEVGFLAEAITDPVGTERALQGAFEDAYHGAEDLFDALLHL